MKKYEDKRVCPDCGEEMHKMLLPDPFLCKNCGTLCIELDGEEKWFRPRLSYDAGYKCGFAIGHQFGEAKIKAEAN